MTTACWYWDGIQKENAQKGNPDKKRKEEKRREKKEGPARGHPELSGKYEPC